MRISSWPMSGCNAAANTVSASTDASAVSSMSSRYIMPRIRWAICSRSIWCRLLMAPEEPLV